MAGPESPRSVARIAFSYPGFVHFQLARFCIVASTEMQSVAVGWQVYEITRRPLDLGLAGLAQFLPGILLFLLAGHVADRFERRKLIVLCYSGFALCSALLLFLSLRGIRTVYPIYVVLVLLGVVRSLNGPVSRALLPQLVPEEHFPSAIAWASSVFQCATILGPSLGGVVYAAFRGPSAVYALGLIEAVFAVHATLQIKTQSKQRLREPVNLQTILAGFHYIWHEKLILGAISLDLFAVLLGGSVALLPVYAREIFETGPWGLGLLRSAPGVGAGVMAILLAYKPLKRRAGTTMLWCVAGFGVATILFAVSRSLVISLAALFLVGATDMVSIEASNELGQFESGLTAQWFGTVPAVVLGGIGTLAVTALWAWRFPELRRADKLTDRSS